MFCLNILPFYDAMLQKQKQKQKNPNNFHSLNQESYFGGVFYMFPDKLTM